MLSREQELWAIALWVEKNHGDGAAAYIQQQVKRWTEAGDEGGRSLWLAIADRFDALQDRIAHA